MFESLIACIFPIIFSILLVEEWHKDTQQDRTVIQYFVGFMVGLIAQTIILIMYIASTEYLNA